MRILKRKESVREPPLDPGSLLLRPCIVALRGQGTLRVRGITQRRLMTNKGHNVTAN